VAERRIAVGSEVVERVGRHNNDVSRLCDDVNTINRLDASSLIDDECLTLRMTVLVRANARRIGAQSDSHAKTPLVKRNEPT
jgi:hypothetical protein